MERWLRLKGGDERFRRFPCPRIWRRHRRLLVLLFIALCVPTFRREIRGTVLFRWFRGEHSTSSRVAQFGEGVGARSKPDSNRAGVPYPPSAVAFLGLKEECVLQVYAAGEDRRFSLIRSYPILAASGALGPKLREGAGSGRHLWRRIAQSEQPLSPFAARKLSKLLRSSESGG